MGDRLERFIRMVSDTFEWFSMVAGWTMTVIVLFDVVLHMIFHYSLRGSWDAVSYLFIIATSFALGNVLITEKFIRFDLFIMNCPKRFKEPLAAIVAFLEMVLSVVIIWQSLVYGRTLQVGTEVSSTANFPIYPFAYGIAIAFFPLFLEFLYQLMGSLKTMFLKPTDREI